jgi:hypothetical protein
MYCNKCFCPKGINYDRQSCRVHIIEKGKCIHCSQQHIIKNCKHEWKSNNLYYLNELKKLFFKK